MGDLGVLGQGGPTGPATPTGLTPEQMASVQAGRYVPPAPGAPATGAGAAQTAAAVTNTGLDVDPGGLTALIANPGNTLAWKAPDLARYDEQYRNSLAASRSGIANQLQRALEDVQANENIANQAIATLPGRFNDIYGQAQGAAEQGLSGLYNALQAQGLGNRYGQGLASQEQLTQPMKAAMDVGRSAFQSTVPLTQLGAQQMYQGQRSQWNLASLGANSELDAQDRAWQAQRQQLEAQVRAQENEFRQQEEARRQQTEQFNVGQQNQARSTTYTTRASAKESAANRAAAKEQDRSITPYQQAQLDMDKRKMDLEESRYAKEQANAVPVFSRQQVGFQKGELLQRGDPAMVAAAGGHDANWFRGQEGYKTLLTEFNKKYKNGVKPDKIEEARKFLLEKARGKPWDNDISILLYVKGLDDSQLGLGSLLATKEKEKGFGKGGWGWWR